MLKRRAAHSGAMRLAGAVLLGLVLLAWPLGAAQVPGVFESSLALTVEGDPAPIVPISSLGQWTVNVTYCYLVPGALAQTATRVELRVDAQPAWATITISPATILVPISHPSEPAAEICAPPQTANVYVALSGDAPLGGSADATVLAHAGENAPIAASDASATITIRVAESGPAPGASSVRDPSSNTTRNATLPADLRDQVLDSSTDESSAPAQESDVPALGPALAVSAIVAVAFARLRGKR